MFCSVPPCARWDLLIAIVQWGVMTMSSRRLVHATVAVFLSGVLLLSGAVVAHAESGSVYGGDFTGSWSYTTTHSSANAITSAGGYSSFAYARQDGKVSSALADAGRTARAERSGSAANTDDYASISKIRN